jgi:hypothetical protein
MPAADPADPDRVAGGPAASNKMKNCGVSAYWTSFSSPLFPLDLPSRGSQECIKKYTVVLIIEPESILSQIIFSYFPFFITISKKSKKKCNLFPFFTFIN